MNKLEKSAKTANRSHMWHLLASWYLMK